MEVATKAYFNLACVPGPNPLFCVSESQRILDEIARQGGSLLDGNARARSIWTNEDGGDRYER